MTDYASVLEDKQDFMDQTDAANAASGGGADLSSVSVLNVAPTGLWNKKNVATAATSEELYPNRKAIDAKLGFGTPAYKEWKTRWWDYVKVDSIALDLIKKYNPDLIEKQQ